MADDNELQRWDRCRGSGIGLSGRAGEASTMWSCVHSTWGTSATLMRGLALAAFSSDQVPLGFRG